MHSQKNLVNFLKKLIRQQRKLHPPLPIDIKAYNSCFNFFEPLKMKSECHRQCLCSQDGTAPGSTASAIPELWIGSVVVNHEKARFIPGTKNKTQIDISNKIREAASLSVSVYTRALRCQIPRTRSRKVRGRGV